jgi:uncharacterized membrane protein YjdF
MVRNIMFAMRAIYAGAIIFLAITGHWSAVLFHGILFLGSLFIPWLGRKDADFYMLDIIVALTFVLSIIPSYYGAWPVPKTIAESLVSFDKIFHMAGGAGLAMFAAILLRKKTSDPWVFYVGIVVFALALGGAWEVLEWIFSLLPPPWGSGTTGYADSMLDLVADTLGATILAGILLLKKYR